VVVFGGVVWYLLGATVYKPSEGIPPSLATLLSSLALTLLLAAHLLPRFLKPPSRGEPEESLLAWHQQTTIIGFALREGAALLALVGALVTGRMVGGAAVAALTLVTMVLAWPREEQIPGR
jgi:hypothetical protein